MRSRYAVWASVLLSLAGPGLTAPKAPVTSSPSSNVVPLRFVAPKRRVPPVRPEVAPVTTPAYERTGSETLEQLEEAYRKTGEWRPRVDVLRKLILRDPEVADWRYKLGETYRMMRWFDDAIDEYVAFAKAWPEDKRFMDACFAIADCLLGSQRFDEDYDYLGTLPQASPEWEIKVAVRKSGLLQHQLQRDYDLSERLLDEIIARYPTDPNIVLARDARAAIYFNAREPKRRDPKRAIDMYEALLADFPTHPYAFYWHRWIAESASYLGDRATVIRHLRTAVDNFPEDYPRDNWQAFNRYTLAENYAQVGEEQDAIREWTIVVEKYPNDTWAESARTSLAEHGVAPPDAPYTLDTREYRGQGDGSGFTIRLTAPATLSSDGLLSPPVVMEVRDGKGPVEKANVSVLVTTPDGQEWETVMREKGHGRYAGSWVQEVVGTYKVAYTVRIGNIKLGKEDLPGGTWKVGPPDVPFVTPADLRTMAGGDPFFLDVRSFPRAWVQGAARVPVDKIADAPAQLPTGRTIAVYDDGYNRYAAIAARRLKKLGFRTVAVKGGFDALKEAGWTTQEDEPAS